MRWVMAMIWGELAAFLGLLGVGPSIPARGRRWLAQLQLLATEAPPIGLIAGIAALWNGARSRNRLATLAGALGAALALRPWFRRSYTDRVMTDAMREGLGLGWQRTIPADVHRGFAQPRRTDQIAPLLKLATARVWETRDVLYAAPDGHPLRLDITQPAGYAGYQDDDDSAAPRPAVIVIHGMADAYGDKSRYGWGLQNRWFAAHGTVVFDVQYRTNSEWPAPLDDVNTAIDWVRSGADRFNVDPARIALLGRSTGAHLALLAAYSGDTSLAAVVASGAPADLRLLTPAPNSPTARLLGGRAQDDPERYEQASPVTHITSDAPPTLVIHGQRDRTVPPNHADLLVNQLRAAGVESVLLRVPGGRHGLDGLPVGLTGSMIQHDIDRFLAWAFFHTEET